MTMEAYEQAAEIIRRNSELADFVGPRPEALIMLAEQRTGLQFPPTYRRFLRDFGAGGFGSTELHGVIDSDFDHSSSPDAIWGALGDWDKGWLPRHLFGVYDLGDGELFCLDFSVPSLEKAIVAYTPGNWQEPPWPEFIASDFGTFLLEAVEREVKWRDEKPPRL